MRFNTMDHIKADRQSMIDNFTKRLDNHINDKQNVDTDRESVISVVVDKLNEKYGHEWNSVCLIKLMNDEYPYVLLNRDDFKACLSLSGRYFDSSNGEITNLYLKYVDSFGKNIASVETFFNIFHDDVSWTVDDNDTQGV